MRRPATFSKVAQPVRSYWHRFAFGVLIIGAFSIMLLGKLDIVLMERFRIAITDATIPILEILSQPSQKLGGIKNSIQDFHELHIELENLRKENQNLLKMKYLAKNLQAENRALRRLNQFVPLPSPNFVSGRVVANSGGAFVRNVLINMGREQGVRRGLAVMSDIGLVGVVVEVGRLFARVLLVTDLNSQIPVLVQNTRDPGILSGDNSNRPRLKFLPQNAYVSTGDIIVTSGEGGVLPVGIPVGTITAVSEAGIRVKPLVDWDHLEYVRVIDYRLRGALDFQTTK